MYKVVIADDEKIIRMGLKNIIDWNGLGFEVTEIFSDGQEVIEYLDYVLPDVILTDIKMNHISGLEVAKFVFEHQLPCKVVLVSGHQEFELAVQGIKYGVEDYQLKPVSVEALEKTFRKIKEALDVQQAEREKQQVDQARMEEAIPLLEEHFFADLVMGVVDSEEYVRSRIGILYPEADVENSNCLLADIYIEDFEDYIQNKWEYSRDQFEVNLNNFLKIYKRDYCFHMVYKASDLLEVVGIYVGGHEKTAHGMEEAAVEDLVKEMEQNFQFQAHFSIRRIYNSVYDIVRLKEDTGENDTDQKYSNQHLQEQKKLVMSNITMGNIVTAQKIFHNILEETAAWQTAKRNNLVIDILSTMNDVIREINEKLSQSLQAYCNYAAILSMGRAEEVKNYCDRIFDRIRLAEEKKEYYDTNSLINKAKAYIQENIYQDISQEETANQLYICPSYLSRLFKKQTGENFTQFVTRAKVEKAIELLKDPQYKTYQVSEMLGYKTPRYFSRLFRAQTGMNPSEYRGKVLQIGGEYDEV